MLGDLVGDRESGLAELHSRGVLDRRLRLDGAERDDLGDLVVAPPLGGVAHHLTAATIVEVDIDIGHRHALGVEKPLEQQTVRDRVDVGDAHRVGDERTGGRTTAGADADADLAGVVDEVADDEEVGGEAHLIDDADLVLGALDVLAGRAGGEATVEAAHDLLVQPARLRLPFRHREDRHPVAVGPHVLVGLHALGDEQRVVARTRHLAVPLLAHLLRRLEVIAVAVELEPGGIGEGLTGLDAQQRLVVRGRILVT